MSLCRFSLCVCVESGAVDALHGRKRKDDEVPCMFECVWADGGEETDGRGV